jgi:peptidylprolyl isomerase
LKNRVKKSATKYKDVRQDKMKYLNALRRRRQSNTGLKYVITKKAGVAKPAKGQHYSSIMQVF